MKVAIQKLKHSYSEARCEARELRQDLKFAKSTIRHLEKDLEESRAVPRLGLQATGHRWQFGDGSTDWTDYTFENNDMILVGPETFRERFGRCVFDDKQVLETC